MNGSEIKNILQAVEQPMIRYRENLKGDLEDWMPLEHAARMLLDGTPVYAEDFVPDFRPIIQMMRMILEKSRTGGWDWADPEVQKTFGEAASGNVYNMYADILVDMVTSILKAVSVGTLVEIGTGSGFVTEKLCRAMIEQGLHRTELIISDQLPAVSAAGQRLRAQFPRLSIRDFTWNIRDKAPRHLMEAVASPVFVFERFSLPYAGWEALDNIPPLADILLLVDDLNLTGEKASFDLIYEKIGTRFLIFKEAVRHLEKHFAVIHSCDAAIAEAIHSPVTTFTLAVK